MHRPNNISGPAVRSLICLMLLSAILLAGMPVIAQEGTPPEPGSLLAGLGYPELTITTDGVDFDIPSEIGADRYRVVLQNDGESDIDLEFFQLPEGASVEDFQAALAALVESGFQEVPDLYFELIYNGGATAARGETGDVVLDLTPGEWVSNLITFDDQTQRDIIIPKVITITGEMPAVEEPTGAFEIDLVEMDVVMPLPIASGPQIWKVLNNGQTGHHLILSQIPAGTTEEEYVQLVSGSSPSIEAGATPAEPALNFEDIVDVFETLILSSGHANWLTVDLAPATYAAVCYLPDKEAGISHVMLGMIEVFSISG